MKTICQAINPCTSCYGFNTNIACPKCGHAGVVPCSSCNGKSLGTYWTRCVDHNVEREHWTCTDSIHNGLYDASLH